MFDDGAVEHHHQLRDRDEDERPAQVRLACRPTARRGLGVDGRRVMGSHGVLWSRWVGEADRRRRGGGRQDDLVDDPGDEVRGRGLAHEEEAVQDDPGQGRARAARCRRRRRSRRAPWPARRSPWRRPSLGARTSRAERLGELGVAGDRGEDRAEGVDLGLVGEAAVAAERGDQVAAQACRCRPAPARGLLGGRGAARR